MRVPMINFARLFCGKLNENKLIRSRIDKAGNEEVRNAYNGDMSDITGVMKFYGDDDCSIYLILGPDDTSVLYDVDPINGKHIFLVFLDYSVGDTDATDDELYECFRDSITFICDILYRRKAIKSDHVFDRFTKKYSKRISRFALYNLYNIRGRNDRILDNSSFSYLGTHDKIVDIISDIDYECKEYDKYVGRDSIEQ